MQNSAKNIKMRGVFFYMIGRNWNRKELMYDLVSITTKLSSCATFTINKSHTDELQKLKTSHDFMSKKVDMIMY